MRVFVPLIVSALVVSSTAFTVITPSVKAARVNNNLDIKTNLPPRGGALETTAEQSTRATTDTALSLSLSGMCSALKAPSPIWKGVAALAGVAFTTLTPLTLLRQGYAFSVGYGAAVAAMAAVLARAFDLTLNMSSLCANTPASLLCFTAIAYGVRLSLHLLVRDATVPERRAAMDKANRSPPLKRVPFAASVSLFYAFMTSPVFYSLRSAGASLPFVSSVVPTAILERVEWAGALVAIAGFLAESVTDTQKFVVKATTANNDDGTFVGPTSGLYAFCRHPNYAGEVLFWFGLFLGGLPHYGTSLLAWATSGLGFYGIYGVMSSATKRLDNKQLEKYGGQQSYDEWRAKTFAMLPFV